MAIHDHSNVSSGALLEGDGGISLEAGEQMPAGECHVPKMRKPYTITKLRERWTEEEHNKFLEAMKLYGRAWKKIEEHIGTKTAVQIRSHAQKFFSKVSRESSHSNSGSIEPIDIPPPRPKRKPAHPYPRKLPTPAKKDAPLQEQLARSVSPLSSVNQANLSPTSVLSTLDGNATSSADWEPVDGSSSPVSSPDNLSSAECLPSEAGPKLQDPISMKLELHPEVVAFGKDGSGETTSVKRLRLFGKTLSVNHDVAEVEEISDAGAVNPENSCQISPALVPYLCYVSANALPIPCWPVYGGIQFPLVAPSNADSLERADDNVKDVSLPVSMNASGSCDGDSDSETQSNEMVKNDLNLISRQSSIANLKSSRSSSEKPQRGFVPYKRSVSEREGRSFPVTGTKEESEMVHLSL